MARIQDTGKQFTITIPKDAMKRMGWEGGTEVYIAKDPDREILYIEEQPKKDGGKNDTKRKNNK